VRAREKDRGRGAGVVGFGPARRADAPAVAGAQARKAGPRRREIVATLLRELEKRLGDLHANDVTADVILVGLATAVAKPSGDRVHRARFEWATQETALRRIRHARAYCRTFDRAVKWRWVALAVEVTSPPITLPASSLIKVATPAPLKAKGRSTANTGILPSRRKATNAMTVELRMRFTRVLL